MSMTTVKDGRIDEVGPIALNTLWDKHEYSLLSTETIYDILSTQIKWHIHRILLSIRMAGHNKWSKIKHKKAITDAQKSKIFSKLARLITVESKKSGGDVNSPGLRAAIEKAKKENMPGDNIERAIKKGVGGESEQMYHVLYEAYGPGGCAIIIEGLTDNKNRTAAEIKHILSKNGLSLAAQGSATWAFEKKDGEWVPKTMTPIPEEDKEKLEKLVEELDENDDVQDVFTNAE